MITEKLLSSSGATVVFALVIFLIVAIFCAVMVNGALSALQNAHEQIGDEQDYLTVASAARLLQAQLAAGSVTKMQTFTQSDPYDWRLTGTEYAYREDDGDEDAVMAAVTALLGTGTAQSLTVTVNGGKAGERMKDVAVTLSLSAPEGYAPEQLDFEENGAFLLGSENERCYDVTARLTSGNGAVTVYSMTLDFAWRRESSDYINNVKYYTIITGWDEDGNAITEDVYYVSEASVTLAWDAGGVSK